MEVEEFRSEVEAAKTELLADIRDEVQLLSILGNPKKKKRNALVLLHR